MPRLFQLLAVVTVSVALVGCNNSVGESTAPEGEGMKTADPGAVLDAAKITTTPEGGADPATAGAKPAGTEAPK